MTTLRHVITRAAWDASTDEVRPASLEGQGFVHLCTAAQLDGVLTRFFAGVDRASLVLLHVDPARLPKDALRWEEADVPGERFPHLYAPLPRAAVVYTEPIPR